MVGFEAALALVVASCAVPVTQAASGIRAKKAAIRIRADMVTSEAERHSAEGLILRPARRDCDSKNARTGQWRSADSYRMNDPILCGKKTAAQRAAVVSEKR
jgi:hypothetical protein